MLIHSAVALVAVSLAIPSFASPVLHSSSNGRKILPRQNASTPCAEVSASVAAQAASTATPTVAAELAYECITSVPLNTSAALNLTRTLRPYWLWQSTIAYLKNPPAEYVEKIQEPIDVWGLLDEIDSNLTSGVWTQEYEFGWALYELLQQTHDGHFVYVPDSIGTVFNWARPVPLVSVSEDFESVPKPYAFQDVLGESLGNITYTPSEVVSINGQTATDFLENWSQYGSLQDRDALYNNVFYQLAQLSLGTSGSGLGTFAGAGRGRWVYPGATTTLGFANGTNSTVTNFARVLIPFDGINSGEDLYRLWFTVPSDLSLYNGVFNNVTTAANTTATASATASATSSATPTSTPAPGYPPPVIRQENNLIGGYYLDGEDYSDVAVLSVPSFVGLGSAEVSFQEVGEQFIADAVAAGKTKLIIDVSANGGGTILQGYDLFKQLFPSILPYGATRFRAFESTNLIGEKFSEIAAGVPRTLDTDNETLAYLNSEIVSAVFNYRTDVDINYENFDSWPDKFGPQAHYGDNFTNIIRWNLSDVLTPYNSGGIVIHGYGNLSNYTTQPFAAEDIIIVYDGYCASTCTIFSELMRQQAGIKTIAMGGRSNKDIIQAVGGVKGTNDYPIDYIQELVADVYDFSTAQEQADYNNTELALYDDATPFYRSGIGTSRNVNFRDGIRQGDTSADQLPLQFVYETADCRIFYTKEMVIDVTAIWKAAADSTWLGTNRCVVGSVAVNSTTTTTKKRGGVHQLRRRLMEDDYPFNVYTELNGRMGGDGWMMP